MIDICSPFCFPPSLTLSSLSSSFVGMTSIFFTSSRLLGEYSLREEHGLKTKASFPFRLPRLQEFPSSQRAAAHNLRSGRREFCSRSSAVCIKMYVVWSRVWPGIVSGKVKGCRGLGCSRPATVSNVTWLSQGRMPMTRSSLVLIFHAQLAVIILSLNSIDCDRNFSHHKQTWRP